MKIDRATVKQQAQTLIKGNLLKLFVITLIVTLLTGGGTGFSFNGNSIDKLKEHLPNSDKSYSSDSDDNNAFNFDFDEGGAYGEDEFNRDFFKDFDGSGKVGMTASMPTAFVIGLIVGVAIIGAIAVAASLLLAPLQTMLAGLYWQFIRGNNMSLGDGLTFVFSKTFDKNYKNKFLLKLIQSLLLILLYALFIIPGVIFTYRWRFTDYIMAEEPELTYKEAMDISKKMTDNHKGELFVLDLSFLGWWIVMGISLGFAGIYVLPYYNTTMALYYENFKIRAMQEGKLSTWDFVPISKKASGAVQMPAGYPVQPVQPSTPYTPPVAPTAPVAPPAPQQEQYGYMNNGVRDPLIRPAGTPMDFMGAPAPQAQDYSDIVSANTADLAPAANPQPESNSTPEGEAAVSNETNDVQSTFDSEGETTVLTPDDLPQE